MDFFQHLPHPLTLSLFFLRVFGVVGLLAVEEIEMLRLEVMEKALSFDDRAFHFHFYSWLISQGLKKQLLEVKSGYLEEFLADRVDQVEYATYLWRLFQRKESFEMAATLQLKVARSSA